MSTMAYSGTSYNSWTWIEGPYSTAGTATVISQVAARKLCFIDEVAHIFTGNPDRVATAQGGNTHRQAVVYEGSIQVNGGVVGQIIHSTHITIKNDFRRNGCACSQDVGRIQS